ncbi:uncharacterized protein LOC129218867 [Uloborus diversus]|uniref:uncharacterized protein LOC129218867 n=1 Tax=Uloborus diversus TaxID=327109 RepID=UPI00240954C0|nr:uncharacterized protein LOC129218867 [Uloborus diversus]
MAYVNVAEWSPEHVAEWLKGLEYSLLPYVHFFLNNEINGCHLLNLTADDLEDLHIFKVGHQQLILEAVELLKQLHYNLTSETLQSLAVKLGCKARSLYNDLKLNGPQEHVENVRQERVSTNVLSAVSEILTSVKALVSWLDRLPFQRDPLCIKLKKTVLKLSIELASTTQRDQFAERPHSLIKRNSLHLAELCDKFVQDSKDSLILQPASLDIAMIKKKPDEELGIHIKSTYSGVHIIGGIKDQSPAKRCNKVEKGDEIIQVNYQTIIGWQQKKLVTAMTEHSTELHLTLKKRPRHINISGEVIILRPYRIPSKTTANKCHKWSEENHLRGQDTCSTSNENDFNDDDDDDSAFLPADATGSHLILTPEMSLHRRLFPYMSPAAVQRRATVSGASPTVLKPPINIEDLVNGVPRIKTSENFGRSISHDPACHKLNVPNLKSEDQLENLKSKDEAEINVEEKDSAKALLVPVTSNADDLLSGDIGLAAFETLPLQEEECSMFENKSLSKTEESCISRKETSDEFASSSKNDTLSDCSSIDSQIADKHTTVLYNWDGVDTEFCGRRPSVQDIANEVAGIRVSDITPVFLRKASKLESSPSKQSFPTAKDTEEMSSYQVVVVGGVPQMCHVDKDKRDKSKRLEVMVHANRKKENQGKKLASRRISCKDLGKGDCEGFLYKQKEKRGFFPSSYQWVKRWIVLKDNFLYSYRDVNDHKAECLISLPGSTVSPALECKTKKYSFKICQPKTTFYFATETLVDLKKWMNKMGLAAIAYDASLNVSRNGISNSKSVLGVVSNFYSESEDSDCGGSPAAMRNLDMKIISNKSYSEAQHNVYNNEETNRSSTLTASCTLQKEKISSKTSSDYFADKSESRWDTVDQFASEVYYAPDSNSKIGKKLNANTHRVTYNRSFSCTESTSNKYSNQYQLIRKMSHESSIRSNIKPVCEQPSMTESSNISITWDAADEECDMLTSSLGRQQKAVAKEITPGLVARMAVSYSNLSQKNALVQPGYSKRSNSRKCIPAPGYVAKISDSFDHMAKTISDKPVRLENREKVFQHALSAKEIVSLKQHPACKRSASESQVSKHFGKVHLNTESGNYSSYLSSNCALAYSKQRATESQPKRFVSLLDKEYNKVFEGKKVSQCQLKSQSQLVYKSCGSQIREMKFFPCSEVLRSKITLQNHSGTNISSDRSSDHQKGSCNSELLYNSPKEVVDIKCQSGNTNVSPLPLHSHEVHSTNQNVAADWSSSFHDKTFESSAGIENIGFSFTDHGSIGSIETEISLTFPNSELGNKGAECLESTSFTDQSSLHNLNLPSAVSSESGSSRNSSFKFFSSPKFMKKLTSPKLDKRNIFKSKKQGKENKKAEQKELTSVQNEKKFFGSPRLVRAIFGSPKSPKKVVTVSSGVQTDNLSGALSHTEEKKKFHDLNRNESFVNALDLCQTLNPYVESQNQSNLGSKSSSNSSLNSNVSNSPSFPNSHYYVETRIKPQITISLPLVSDKSNENTFSPGETLRTPLKPTMGVAMLSKKRLPSISGESSVSISSKSSHDGSLKEAAQICSEVSVDVNSSGLLLPGSDMLVPARIQAPSSLSASFSSTPPKYSDLSDRVSFQLQENPIFLHFD